jgi:hypothetical protein
VARRLAARLITGPFAFLVAGVLDVALLGGRYALRRAGMRLFRQPID